MVKYINRTTGMVEVEKIPAQKLLSWIYKESGLLNKGVRRLLRRKTFSHAYGGVQKNRFSKFQINSFIKKYKIDLSEYIIPVGGFKNFNDFFVRKLKSGARPLIDDKNVMIAPCDGRYLPITEIKADIHFDVKNCKLTLKELLGDVDCSIYKDFDGGNGFICRLAPTDYHRFHFPDAGVPMKTKSIKGKFDSVSPLALKSAPDVLFKNKRTLTIFRSQNFGDLAYIEVGAMFVGTIVQTFTPELETRRGSEKGYFQFGGSTVVVLAKKGAMKIDEDIIENANKGYETFLKMGNSVGKKVLDNQ